MSSLNKHSFYKDTLHQTVDTSTEFNNLLPILQSIPLNKIKSFINETLSELNDNSTTTLYFDTLPVEQILPDDILQHILSFDHNTSYYTRRINKKWKQLSANYERNSLIKQYKSINKRDPPFKFDNDCNDTWIIDPKRKSLHQKEIALGYKGPKNRIESALKSCKSGDRLLIHNGSYTLCEEYGLSINKDVQLIGVGSAVTIKCSDVSNEIVIGQMDECNVYIDNIMFDCSLLPLGAAIRVCEDSNLWMDNCKLTFNMTGLTVRNNANLNVKHCEFNGGTRAVLVSPYANNVNITESTFRNCGNESPLHHEGEVSCISIECQYGEIYDVVDKEILVWLTCIGNVFEDNLGVPVAERHWPEERYIPFILINTDRYELEDNVLRGYNGNKVQSELMIIEDANTLYYNDQPSLI